MTDEVLTWGIRILFGIWGTMLLKHWLDERKAKRQLFERALYLRGKIAGFHISQGSNPSREIQSFNDGLGKLKGSSGYIQGMIGYLDRYAQEVEELYNEHKALAKELRGLREYTLSLRQQVIDAGGTPPEMPDDIKRDFDAYNAMVQKARASRRAVDDTDTLSM